MHKRFWWFVILPAVFVASLSFAQFSILDMVADKVIQRYQMSTCEQLWMKKDQPKLAEEQRVIGLLRSDPAMRTEFLNRVAAPIANKMFECGMIP
ncbi:MAG: hypothetical protein NOF05_05985 [Candidatus Accumulibacter phosphatis]|uniref:Uncharacterized protein n=1 Tax=Candidatus Accumulibacter cognatus TaxID=2954383 RepID=A0A7D5S838_9PROT|nr:hypothetical protein [Accumulibacter sp.]MCC2868967.1 hypothetical protein [Candidatus Accumulibacter phosphatis]QLH48560.1 MAG: hypothetical protein HWD57_01205 [Candidatus Accumulibacter cognatus]MBN8520107.1 hypothetical protein [Accumulibacter sp.]MBO3711730.1 hypothetical protein [Accumulibacter sp.]MCM8577946.1 hypothetical protein [Accumulibacter sp.]